MYFFVFPFPFSENEVDKQNSEQALTVLVALKKKKNFILIAPNSACL